MTTTSLLRRRAAAPLLATAALIAALGAPPADAAKAKAPSCSRGGAKLQQRAGDVAILRQKAKPRKKLNETPRENVLACWIPTGKRTTLSIETDMGADNRASTDYEIVDGRYAGVVATNEGGQTISIAARIYDVRGGKLLHDSRACEALDRGDIYGIDDVAFLPGGGMAFACNQLVLYRSAKSAAEQLEPVGTDVRQVAVTRYSNATGLAPRLFWAVGYGADATAKSLSLR